MKLPNATATPSISDAVSGHPSAAHPVTRRSDGISSPPSNSALVEPHGFDTELRRQGKPQARSADRARPAVHATSRECDFVKLGIGKQGSNLLHLGHGQLRQLYGSLSLAAPTQN